jgi:tetratricopeptide (TPR) repeat protein
MKSGARSDLNRPASLKLLLASLCFLGAAMPALEQSAGASPRAERSRLTVSVLDFEDQTGDAAAGHWRYTIARMLREQLSEIKSLRVIRTAAAGPQLNPGPTDPISLEQARRIGELVEARRVIWGTCRREGQKWVATARILNVASGRSSGEISADSEDWYGVRDQLTAKVLAEMGLKPTGAERRRLSRRSTSSPAALEWFSQAHAGQREKKPLAEMEACLRKALGADPRFPEALAGLAAVLGSQGNSEPAEEAIRQALQLRPNDARFHRIHAFVLSFKPDMVAAEKELREALRLEPEDPETLSRLGECHSFQGRLDDAIACWQQTTRLDPADAGTHAHLGEAYAKKGRREPALAELAEAERLGPEDLSAQQMIWQAYAALHDIPLAAQHLDTFVGLARKQGQQPKLVASIEETGRDLKARLTPCEITASMPRLYTPESLQAALRERLTDSELKLAINPLASTPEMDRWARELTTGAQGDVPKAKKIFEALARRLQTGEGGVLTAREVFAGWKDPARSFSCQEFAKLYVALARAVGLKVFYVHLEKDYLGDCVYHDCAALFSDGKAFLVDPAYLWFGAPHKDFLVLDDLQTVAHHFFQPSEHGSRVARCRLAAKLHPDSAWGQVHLASAWIDAKQWEPARKALAAARLLEPSRWDELFHEGVIAAQTGEGGPAIEYLHKSLALNPKLGPTHLLLAQLLRDDGQLQAAREEFRLALASGLPAQLSATAQHAIAELNENSR